MRRAIRIARRWVGREADDSTGIVTSPAARAVVAAGVLAYVYLFTAWSLDNYWGFAMPGFDVGIFDQGVWLLSRFEEPFVTVRGLHLFGDHSSFILLLVAPLYRLFSSAVVLLVLQSLALGFGAVLVFLIGREKLRHEVLAAGMGLVYLLQPALQWTNLENFHPDSFEVPLLLLAFYTMMNRRWRLYFLAVGLLLLVKEDVALTTFALGAFVAFRYDKRAGLVTMGASMAWLAAVLFFIIPGFGEGQALYTGRVTGRFGGIGGFIRAALTRPWEIASVALGSEQRTYLWQLFAPLALLPLASSIVLVALPALAINLLTTFGYQHNIRFHYSTLILPVVVVAAISAISKIRMERHRYASVAIALVVALLTSYMWGPAVGGRGFRADRSTPYVAAARRAVEMIPPDAAVSADFWFVPHLTHRRQIYEFPNPWIASNWGDASREGEELPSAGDIRYILVRDSIVGEGAALLEELRASRFVTKFSSEGIILLEGEDR